jgi:hypothetical protein
MCPCKGKPPLLHTQPIASASSAGTNKMFLMHEPKLTERRPYSTTDSTDISAVLALRVKGSPMWQLHEQRKK